MTHLGVEIGNRVVRAAVFDGQPRTIEVKGRLSTPLAVACDDGELLVGQAAKDEATTLESVLSWRRHLGTDKTYELGGQTFTPVDLTVMILEQVNTAAEATLGAPIGRVVMTLPTYFTTRQKDAVRAAAERAGLRDTRLLAEPVAAALAYEEEGTVLVYGLGSATFDVAIVNCVGYRILAVEGDHFLGGDDFDNLLIAHVEREVKSQAGVDLESSREAKQMVKNECEKAKIKLSERENATIRLQAVIGGKTVNLALKITRDEFEKMIMPMVDATMDKVASAIAKATGNGRPFVKDDIDAILLVGGSTRVPLVERRLACVFGKHPMHSVDPELVVVYGAAMRASLGDSRLVRNDLGDLK